VDMM